MRFIHACNKLQNRKGPPFQTPPPPPPPPPPPSPHSHQPTPPSQLRTSVQIMQWSALNHLIYPTRAPTRSSSLPITGPSNVGASPTCSAYPQRLCVSFLAGYHCSYCSRALSCTGYECLLSPFLRKQALYNYVHLFDQ